MAPTTGNYIVRRLNQLNKPFISKRKKLIVVLLFFSAAAWYPVRSDYGVGVNNIILMKDLKDTSKGYLVNDAIVFEAEIVKVSVTNIVPV